METEPSPTRSRARRQTEGQCPPLHLPTMEQWLIMSVSATARTAAPLRPNNLFAAAWVRLDVKLLEDERAAEKPVVPDQKFEPS